MFSDECVCISFGYLSFSFFLLSLSLSLSLFLSLSLSPYPPLILRFRLSLCAVIRPHRSQQWRPIASPQSFQTQGSSRPVFVDFGAFRPLPYLSSWLCREPTRAHTHRYCSRVFSSVSTLLFSSTLLLSQQSVLLFFSSSLLSSYLFSRLPIPRLSSPSLLLPPRLFSSVSFFSLSKRFYFLILSADF